VLTRNPTSFDNLKRNISEIMKGVFTKDRDREEPKTGLQLLTTKMAPESEFDPEGEKDPRGSTSREEDRVEAEVLQTNSSKWDSNPDVEKDSEVIDVERKGAD